MQSAQALPKMHSGQSCINPSSGRTAIIARHVCSALDNAQIQGFRRQPTTPSSRMNSSAWVRCLCYYSNFSRTFHSGTDPPFEASTRLRMSRSATTWTSWDLGWLSVNMLTWRGRYRASIMPIAITSWHTVVERQESIHTSITVETSRRWLQWFIEPGIVICVESYIGEEGGIQGVKLE